MTRLHIQFSKVLLATIVSLGSLATVSAIGNFDKAVADHHTTKNGSMSQQMSADDTIVQQLVENESFDTLVQAVSDWEWWIWIQNLPIGYQ